MITIHWLENSRAQRIIWLFEELSLEYAVKEYTRDPVTRLAPPELFALHPLGKSPVITFVENGKTRSLAESGAIVEYVIEKYGRTSKMCVGVDSDLRSEYLYWLHFAEGSAMSLGMIVALTYRLKRMFPEAISAPALAVVGKMTTGYIKPRLLSQWDYVESCLEGKKYLLGDELTGCDIMLTYPADAMRTSLGFGNYPNIAAWFKRCEERPAYIRAEAKGAKADLAPFLGGRLE